MPRLPPSTLHRAARISPALRALLPVCRTLASAQAELRWIRQHVLRSDPASASPAHNGKRAGEEETLIRRLVARRAAGEPLQYVLASQPFGPLDLACARGVLIPRGETEAWVERLSGVLGRQETEVGVRTQKASRVLDCCSGSGCVGLLVYALLARSRGIYGGFAGDCGGEWRCGRVKVCGIDVETRAVALAQRNLRRNIQLGTLPGSAAYDIVFRHQDLFEPLQDWLGQLWQEDEVGEKPERRDGAEFGDGGWSQVDVLLSNPPYISARGFACDTGRSVRNFEPKLALVPEERAVDRKIGSGGETAPEDVFYDRLLDVAERVKPSILVFEVGDLKQAVRVVDMVVQRDSEGDVSRPDKINTAVEIEVWRDWPDMVSEADEETETIVRGRMIPIRGSGHGRCVFVRRGTTPA